MTETFAQRLRRLRDEHGLSIRALAEAARVSEGAIRQLESGITKSPAFTTGLRLADALHVEPERLAFGEAGLGWAEVSALAQRIDDVEARLGALERGKSRPR